MDGVRKIKQAMKKAGTGKGSTNFLRLKELIRKLEPEEVKIAKAYITSFDTRGKSNKSSEIFDSLFANPNLDETFLREKYKTASESSFDAIVSLLKDKIHYSLTLEVNTQREGGYSEKWKAQLDVREKLNIYDILYGKALYDEAYNVLMKIIEKCKQYELYFEFVSALMKKMEFLKLRIPTKDLVLSKEFLEINKQIQFNIDCLHALITANNWYYIHIGYGELEGKGGKIYEEYKKGIAVLENEYNYTNSATVAHYMFILKTTYYDATKDYVKAEKTAKEWIQLVSTNKAVSMPIRIGAALTYLANILMNQSKFTECLTNLEKAKKYFKPNTSNYQIVEDLEIYCFFYLGNYKKAEEKVLSVMDHPPYRQFLFKENRRKYLYACILFVQEKYGECLKVLQGIEELKEDRSGFLVGIKILTVLCAFYNGDSDFTHYRLESLRKLLRSLHKESLVKKRDALIYAILSEWIKLNGDFKALLQKRKDDFLILESNKSGYAWEVSSHELIILNEWFKLKSERKPYKLNVSEYKKNQKSISKKAPVISEF